MISIWILPKFTNPVKAVQNGKDEAVCGDCPLRGEICYVNVAYGPNAVYKAYKSGKYTKFANKKEFEQFFKGKNVRFGSYGEITAIPITYVRAICKVAHGWTGYSHQFLKPWAQPFKQYLMASADSEEKYIEAKKLGWRTFRVKDILDGKLPNEIVCPASVEGGKKTQCNKCLLCNGTDNNRKPASPRDIVIDVHGLKWKQNNYRTFSLPMV